MLRAGKPHPERQSVRVATRRRAETLHRLSRGGGPRLGADGVVARARLLPAIAAGEGVAGDALVPPDEDVSVDAAPAEAKARCRGKRVRVVRVPGVAVGRVRIARSQSRSGEEGGRPEGQASLGKGWSGERDEHEGPEADHEGLHLSLLRLQHRDEPAVALRPANLPAAPTGPYSRAITWGRAVPPGAREGFQGR